MQICGLEDDRDVIFAFDVIFSELVVGGGVWFGIAGCSPHREISIVIASASEKNFRLPLLPEISPI